MVMGVALALTYAALTSVLMLVAARRWWGPVLMHGGLIGVVALLARPRNPYQDCLDGDLAVGRGERGRVALLHLVTHECPAEQVFSIEVRFQIGRAHV